MSWSFNLIGRPEKVISKIEEISLKMDRATAAEFNKAKPHLIGIVQLNSIPDVLVKLEASGTQVTSAADPSVITYQLTVNCNPIFGAML